MALPPPQPAYILRGHASQIHALEFSPTNTSLLSGDAEGYVVCWSLASKRATASWRAHNNAVLGVAWWTKDIVVTHGRDSQLHFWKLGNGLDTILPVDKHANMELIPGKLPLLFHSMTVNTLNFCAFTWTSYYSSESQYSYLLALPHTLSSEAIDIFQLTIASPASDVPIVEAVRKTTIPPPNVDNPRTGLTMGLSFQHNYDLLAGYESGHTFVFKGVPSTTPGIEKENANISWDYSRVTLVDRILNLSYQSREHHLNKSMSQTAADSKLVTHMMPSPVTDSVIHTDTEPCNILNTKHSGQQGLSIRDDGLLMATAGWDSKGRVYRAPVVKAANQADEVVPPKEIAVLKWHKEGCYCTAFAHVLQTDTKIGTPEESQEVVESVQDTITSLATKEPVQTITTTQRRENKAQKTHWLALGSKDGKISLWDIL